MFHMSKPAFNDLQVDGVSLGRERLLAGPVLAFRAPEAEWHYLVEQVLRDRLEVALGVVVSRNLVFDATKPWLERNLSAFSLVVVDAGLWDHLDDLITFCQGIRHMDPHMPILLLSADVSSDDFSHSREPICDATLRLPLSADRVFDGIIFSEAGRRNAFARRRVRLSLGDCEGEPSPIQAK